MYLLVKRVATTPKSVTLSIIDYAELISALIMKSNEVIKPYEKDVKMTVLPDKFPGTAYTVTYILMDDTAISFEIYPVRSFIQKQYVFSIVSEG